MCRLARGRASRGSEAPKEHLYAVVRDAKQVTPGAHTNRLQMASLIYHIGLAHKVSSATGQHESLCESLRGRFELTHHQWVSQRAAEPETGVSIEGRSEITRKMALDCMRRGHSAAQGPKSIGRYVDFGIGAPCISEMKERQGLTMLMLHL